MKNKFVYILLFLTLLISCNACSISNTSNNSTAEFKKSTALPQKAKKLLNTGISNIESNDIPAAIKDFEYLVRLYPDLPIAHYNLGLAYAKNKQIEKAINSWENAIFLDTDYADAYYNLGLAYKMTNNPQKAGENFVRYAMLKPNDPNINLVKDEILKLKVPNSGKGIISRISITDEVDENNNIALSAKNIFKPDTQIIYTSIQIIDAPKDTNLTARWYYLTFDKQKLPINSTEFKINGNKNVLLSIQMPESGWPVGRYELDILLNNNINAIVPFDILR